MTFTGQMTQPTVSSTEGQWLVSPPCKGPIQPGQALYKVKLSKYNFKAQKRKTKTNTNPNPDPNRYRIRCPDPNARIQEALSSPYWVPDTNRMPLILPLNCNYNWKIIKPVTVTLTITEKP